MSKSYKNRVHHTFPLARQVLDSYHLFPDFDYPQISFARELGSLLNNNLYRLSSAEVAAAGLMGKIFLYLLESFQETTSPTLFSDLDKHYLAVFDNPTSDPLYYFIASFPTSHTFHSSSTIKEFLHSTSQSDSGIEALWKYIILISLANGNPAFKKIDGVFADSNLWNSSEYLSILKSLDDFFTDYPSGPSVTSSLLELLREPSRAHPDSIQGQLEFIRHNWAHLIGEDYFLAILKSLDWLKEEQIRVPGVSNQDQDPLKYAFSSYHSSTDLAQFSKDVDWMPRVTLLAKNIFVWLDQLSKHYQRPIHRLDQIPDDELKKLSDWGFTGLWLIGIWERSKASQRIKQLCGNIDAVPSAYSLYDYTISDAIGGETAYEALSARAISYQIRLAADMVPNHMGISSNWVAEFPERFLSLDNSPYPNYSFNGPDLSTDTRFSIFLEDHYYDKTDAAVVFKRIDNQSQSTKYIYHGNDGTSVPWNDTAQLDFLRQDVREAVIQTIIQVAKRFPIIRFDAAMTLAKKHYQRLWFPEPGSGGAIPTRSDFGITKKQFDQLLPVEFWREVVDRVSQEAPSTLLLAEAFWMMEGYFVRTLGMHRVYNSAFMHMLRDEDNAKYRRLIINTLELDPEILKRYVNFMNNPDEDTAIAQFGSDGKYFGTCVLMSTLPGLPMFGHGQVEGYSEKYGMEYQRAYYQELPNQDLINRHVREIFPLLLKRYLFAEVSQFILYEYFTENSGPDEDVFAYSNRVITEAALVVFHNKWGTTKGQIKDSVPINGKSISLFNGLSLNSKAQFIIFRDQITNLEYIRKTMDISNNGLQFELGAYQYHVFLDFESVSDPSGYYAILEAQLNGGGTENIEKSLIDIKYTPIINIFLELVQVVISAQSIEKLFTTQINNSISNLENALSQIESYKSFDFQLYRESLYKNLSCLLNMQAQPEVFSDLGYISILSWLLLKDLSTDNSSSEWPFIIDIFAYKLSASIDTVPSSTHLIPKTVDLLMFLEGNTDPLDLTPRDFTNFWFSTPEVEAYLDVHSHDGITWFNKESFELLIEIFIGYHYIYNLKENKMDKEQLDNTKIHLAHLSSILQTALSKSDYQVEKYISLIKELPAKIEVE